ncbi:helix-turn-helix transcriptional regulator [Methylobacterium durans]|uniref:helix-turn-helix transcriptional regulator n=1 Tax=Methylobacterium durans TaxID=2202825 RepID=UPI001F48DA84|nr:helix-turn-helix transcriptional regulator [Methylobacterium durans]
MVHSHPERSEQAKGAGADEHPHGGDPARSTKWNYTTGVKLYHRGNKSPLDLSLLTVNELPAEERLPGIVCQAARDLLGLTQQDFARLSDVSKKTINDYENQKLEPGRRILRALRETLEREGARFYVLGDAIGVVASRACVPGRG